MARKLPPEAKQERFTVFYRQDTDEGRKIHEWRKKQPVVSDSIRRLILKEIDGGGKEVQDPEVMRRFVREEIARMTGGSSLVTVESCGPITPSRTTETKSGVGKFFDEE